MMSQLTLLATTLTFCVGSIHGAGSDFFHTSLAAPWKVPTLDGRRCCLSSSRMSISSFLLQVRGGSSDRDPNGFYYNDDDSIKRTKSNRYSSREYDDREDKQNDDYYHQDRNYYEEERRYDDRDYDDRGVKRTPSLPLSGVPSLIKYGDHKLGIALLAFGTFFTISGITLFFHKTLLRMGNLLIIAGVPMTIGPGRTAGFFLQPKKARATGFLVFGIFLVFIGWPIFGIALEIFGLLNLFGNMLPLAYTMLKQMPIVGGLLPTKKKKKKESRSRDDDDRYYQDDRYYYRDEDQGRDTGERYY